ncbi:dTDP-4-dehydrorhamnose 3,5-epimerase [Algoriphagus ratkowskyi]|nr:dTDP-4-dehydrorhamnose 3,5-epimerase [Algoriphagus ratkowskyi]
MYLLDLEERVDTRGFFARNFCINEFRDQGIDFTVVQSNMSYSKQKGTLRGLHYQSDCKEAKVVRCTRGVIFDVVIDLRPNSVTFLQYDLNELSEFNHKEIYVPPGCAHGFLTLEADSEINYLVSAMYSPELEKGLRYNDTILKDVQWPIPIQIITEKDLNYPDYDAPLMYYQ